MSKYLAVHKNPSISPVWIVPAVALIIAIWLAVQARMEKGEMIEIAFSNASDIIAGQTLVKLKDVEVGFVKRVELSKDLRSVMVKVELDSSASAYLGENTRFWVVTPRISAAGVSNLGTLISGVYIVMDPGEKGRYTTAFKGLDESPAFESDEPGRQYTLKSDILGSLDTGSPVYFRQVRVGEVTGYKLAKDYASVDVNIFIRAPYDELVHTKSRFWNVSGFGFSVGAEGVKAQMASLASILNGGIAFDNAVPFESRSRAEAGHLFHLHPDRESVVDGQFNIEYYYLLKFSGTVRGLNVGAPVEFRGLKVGEVINIELANSENADNTLHVYIAMEPQRFDSEASPTREQMDNRIDAMVREGLRGQMKTASLLTGSRFIDLSYVDINDDSVAQQTLTSGEKFSAIPTIDDPADQITNQLVDILTKVEGIPFEDIGTDLADSMASLSVILGVFEQQNTAVKVDGAVANLEQTLASANDALSQVAQAMKSVDQILAPDSELKYELTKMLKSIREAARSVDALADELSRHPSALIMGVDKDE
ncbi:MAG: hypothetical protein COA42_03320 [Alteromonadaceae bacterium]|nr:MAG: hypothetical protein COA42_03320 [Alteromonadaceae bacterium]